MSGRFRIERVVTEGKFALDGGEWNVDNNIWLIGDDTDVVIVDAAHTAQAIIDEVGGRHVNAVICTHGSGRRWLRSAGRCISSIPLSSAVRSACRPCGVRREPIAPGPAHGCTK